MTDLNPQWGLEALSGLVALAGALTSARFALRWHASLRSIAPHDRKHRPAQTRRRIVATFFLVQTTLFVACCYRLSLPIPKNSYIPGALRLVMAVAVLRTCLKNEREWTGDNKSSPLVFDQGERYH